MSNHLVIVESPAKAKTIKKYLGKGFTVMASYGHVRDLVPKTGAVEPDNNFAMHYEIIEKNKKHVAAITKALKNSDSLYLATDPDREGEAISWHLSELLKEKKALKDKPVYRVVFYEVTKSAVKNAIDHPGELAKDLINAYKTRRALDYLVGFTLSPILWKKITAGLSAGRVQSPAERLIVEREEEILAFQTQEYWTMHADLIENKKSFSSKLIVYDHKKLEQFSITNEEQAKNIQKNLMDLANGKLKVINIEKKERKRNPAPPFITSTLQQEAARKLGFSAQYTMRIAQQLYEGIDTGDGPVGLITYMRTDSVNVAAEAIKEIRQMIQKKYGDALLPETPNFYKTKSKNAQEAHEAIRPTAALRNPKSIKNSLSPDQYKLYELIWKRTLASQMVHALIATTSIDLQCGAGNLFRTTGSIIANPGFIKVYQEGNDHEEKVDQIEGQMLPDLTVGQLIELEKIRPEQHFTQPPPRYTEASLIKTLEEYGIGRPSTYASIIATLLNRNYARLENKRFVPTDIGRLVNSLLTTHFTQYVDYEFTANLEDELDAVSRGEKNWTTVLKNFWSPFIKLVEEKENSLSRADVKKPQFLGHDPATGKSVTAQVGRYGPYVQIGTHEDEQKPKFASLRPGQSIFSITLEEALALFSLPRKLGKTEAGEPIEVNIGRFGPYVKYGNKFVSIKKEDPYTIELPRALELIEAKKEADKKRIIKTFPNSDIQILRSRFGPYIVSSEKRIRAPKDIDPLELTLEECKELLEASKKKKKVTKKSKKK